MKKFLLILIILVSFTGFSQSENDKSYEEISKVSFFPNPVTGDYITITTKFEITVTLYDLLGKSVLTKTISPDKNKINIGDISSGIYLIKFSNGQHSSTKKFIRQ